MIPLLILGMLKENPGAHGYELLRLMTERHYHYVVNFTKGSFYYNLQQLEEKNWLERLEPSSPPLNKNKEAYHYQLTEAGDKQFKKLMVKYGSKTDYVTLSFYAPLLFAENYEPEEFKQLIKQQLAQTEEKIRKTQKALETPESLVPAFAKMLENSIAHHQVNLKWYQELLNEQEKEPK